MELLIRRYLIVLPIVAAFTLTPPPCLAYSINDPIPTCVIKKKGPIEAPTLRAPSAPQATTCLGSYTRYLIPDPAIDANFDLLYSGFFLGHPYMSGNQPRDFLRALDHPDSAGKNEFHVNQKDTQLLFNYFHAIDSTEYYGSPSFGGPNMLFFTSSGQDQSDRNHLDIYLNHQLVDNIAVDFYPAHLDNPDRKEDLPLTGPCLEYYDNAIQARPLYRPKRVAPDFFTVVNDSDATWFQSGNPEQTRINHESQHLFFKSSGHSGNSFPNETFSMAAEFIGGAQLRDAYRPVNNNVYDRPLNWGTGDAAKANLGFSHWYLWMAYLYLKFPGDTTKIEDDLLYKYVRYKDGSVYNNQMYGLAQTLANPTYASLGGATGNERLRNLLHNYSLAKWINNASPSFYGGLYGFGRGVVPSRAPGFFDNSFSPCDKYTALEVPPTFVVGPDRASTDSTITGNWCVTDYNQGTGCTAVPSRVTCDTLGVWLYGADYIQFQADPYFDNGKQNTLHFKMTWNPSTYPGTGHSGNTLRVTAISYPITSDSLYVHGDLATATTEAVIDSLHGMAQLWIPNFGTSTKSVVVSIDLGEITPPQSQSTAENARRFFYGYNFGVDVASLPPTAAIELKAHRVGAMGADSLKWTDPGSCGTSGYYIQRSFETEGSPVTFDSTSAGIFTRAYPTSGDTLRYYRVVAKGGSGCASNFATLGGHVRQNHTINGVLYLSGDLTVDYQKTLTVSPGTLVRIRPNADSRQEGTDTGKTEVTVNGRLDAIGTAIDSIRWVSDASAPAAGDWKGLRMLNASDNTSRLDYNAIRFAYHGLYLEECAPRIDHCRIQQNTFYGIYAFGDSSISLITNCILEQNHGAEMMCAFGAAPTVKNCHLHYSPSGGPGAIDDGAVFSGGGTGVFRMNRIVGVGMGVYCATLSNPSFIGSDGSNPFGRNDILEFRSYGVRTYDQSLPVIGLNDNPGQENHFQSGRNNIFSAGFPTAVFVQNTVPALHVKAQYCYWNGVAITDTTKFKGLIDNNNLLAGFDQVAGPGWYYPNYQAAPGLRTPDEVFAVALGKELAGDLEGAVAAYKGLLTDFSGTPLTAHALSRLLPIQMRRGKAPDELAYTASLEATAQYPELRRLAKRYRPSLLLAANQRDAALERYSTLLNDELMDRPGVLLEMAILKGKILGDVAGARAAISDLQQCTTDRHLLKHARAMLEEVVGVDIWIELPEPAPSEAVPSAVAQAPVTLEQSSPNPMNPRASIAFSLPRSGRAALRVYDVQGKVVRTLLDADLDSGRHIVEWDGRTRAGNSVASGVYYYRLEFGGERLVHKMIVLK